MTQTLPPDPEGMNDKRASWALEAIEAFCATTGTDASDAISDLLSDIMHLCDREGGTFGSFEPELRRARNHYAEETKKD